MQATRKPDPEAPNSADILAITIVYSKDLRLITSLRISKSPINTFLLKMENGFIWDKNKHNKNTRVASGIWDLRF